MTANQELDIALALLARYGVTSWAGLTPLTRLQFDHDLEAALAGRDPHPADSMIDPEMCEVQR